MKWDVVWVDMERPEKLFHAEGDYGSDAKALEFARRLINLKKSKGQIAELAYVHRRRGWGLLEPACLTPHTRLKALESARA